MAAAPNACRRFLLFEGVWRFFGTARSRPSHICCQVGRVRAGREREERRVEARVGCA